MAEAEQRDSQQASTKVKDTSDGQQRAARFVDVGKESQFLKSKKLQLFYKGAALHERMAEIRKSIYYIRQHWDEFEQFLQSLKQLLAENVGLEFEDETVRSHTDKLLTSKRDWLTDEQVSILQPTYEAIKVYTSTEGYWKLYNLSNEIFRQEDSISNPKTIRDVVFLVELLNIDLFNYCQKCPELENFQGEIYRGMCLEEADLQTFRSLRTEPKSQRNIAVPLGLLSGSASLDVARKFVNNALEHPVEGKACCPVLVKIHVIRLKDEYTEHYKKRFPSAVLTTICAVDISGLSTHPDEQEVLLRGPFLQVLDVYEDDGTLLGRPCDVLEAVMLNANRDHISTSQLGDEDALARDLFATMVAVTRSEFAKKFCEEKGLVEDAEEYQKILDESLTKLKDLMTK